MTELNPYDPPDSSYEAPNSIGQQDDQDGPSGLGGWLILVGIGIVLTPFRTGIFMLQVFVPLFTDGTWESLTTPSSEYYNPLWAPVLIFEVVVNVAFIIAYSVLAILFFQRSRYFPKAYIVISITCFVSIIVDTYLGSLVLPNEPVFDPDTAKELIRSVVSISIWVPYMLLSKRVKNTFV